MPVKRAQGVISLVAHRAIVDAITYLPTCARVSPVIATLYAIRSFFFLSANVFPSICSNLKYVKKKKLEKISKRGVVCPHGRY